MYFIFITRGISLSKETEIVIEDVFKNDELEERLENLMKLLATIIIKQEQEEI